MIQSTTKNKLCYLNFLTHGTCFSLLFKVFLLFLSQLQNYYSQHLCFRSPYWDSLVFLQKQNLVDNFWRCLKYGSALFHANRSCPVFSASILIFGILFPTHSSGRFALTSAAENAGGTILPHLRTCPLLGITLPSQSWSIM